MEDNRNEIKDSNLKKGVLGFLIGLAVIVPGVSGATIAIIFKLYDKLLHAIGNIIKEFKVSLCFLLPIVIGAALGFIFGFFTVQRLLELIPFAIICLFAGLMVGSIPSLKDEISSPLSRKTLLLFVIGLIIPVGIGITAIVLSQNNVELTLKYDVLSLILYVLVGMLVSVTQFVPGCSATATLMALGLFVPLMSALHFTYIKEDPKVLLIFVALAIGFLVGCVLVSKGIDAIITKFKGVIYYLFMGLSVGSVVCLFFNKDMLTRYEAWNKGTVNPLIDVLVGIVLLVLGFFVAYKLVIYMRKKNDVKEINTKQE